MMNYLCEELEKIANSPIECTGIRVTDLMTKEEYERLGEKPQTVFTDPPEHYI